MKLIWLDLETTGLDPVTDKILEVGCVVTDPHLFEVDRFHAVVKERLWLETIDPVVVEMHGKSGLLADVCRPTALDREFIESRLVSFLTGQGLGKDCYLAGSSVHFDRSFLARHMPEVLKRVSHRMLDVTTLFLLAKAWIPDLQIEKETPVHRVIPDIEGSIRELRRYQRILFKEGIGPVLEGA
jgi:oligoribonuclease